jgi:hypothetical protein
MSSRAIGVSVGSLVGSFFVYAAHVACGGGAVAHRAVTSAPAQTVTSSSSMGPEAAPVAAKTDAKTDGCGCAAPRTTAYFAVSGDDKIAIDPVDAQASLDLAYVRGPVGKKQIVLSGVVRGYRTDVLAEHPTTFAIRVTYPEGTTPAGPLAAKDIEAHVSTWGAGAQFAPRVYAAVAKSAVTVTVTDSIIEIRGSLTLRDPPTGRTIVLDKLSLRKSGTALLPERNAVWKP